MQGTLTPDTRQAQAEAAGGRMQKQQLGRGEQAEQKHNTEQQPVDQLPEEKPEAA